MKFPISQINSLLKALNQKFGLYSVWGQFGVGKTIFSLQTAILYAKNHNKVLFIYTKPLFPTQQLVSILEPFPEPTKTEILNNLTFIQITEFDEFYTLLFNLEFLLLTQRRENQPLTKLLIIDNIINLYQLELNPQDKERNVELNYSLNQMLGLLSYLNQEYKLDISLVNRTSYSDQENITLEIPAGGNVIEYWIPYSLKIQRTKKINERKFIFKTSSDSKKPLSFVLKLAERGFVE